MVGTRLAIVILVVGVTSSVYGSPVFEDAFARGKMYPAAAAAYADDPSKCLANALNATMVHRTELKCDDWNNTCAAFVAVSPRDKAVILSFRGTETTAQLLLEIGDLANGGHSPFAPGGKVNSYFKDAFDVLWNNGILAAVNTARHDYPSYEIWVTGHSLGGSMAALAGLFLVQLSVFPRESIRLMTFGQPRTGDSDFSAAVDYHLPYVFRVIHLRDLVPHFPLQIAGYAHHQEEIFYPNEMASGAAYQICPGDENESCSNSWADGSITDHLWYFNHHLSQFGIDGCVETSKNSDHKNFIEDQKEAAALEELERRAEKSMHPKNTRKQLEAIENKFLRNAGIASNQ